MIKPHTLNPNRTHAVVIDRHAEALQLAAQREDDGPVTAESIKASADAFVAAQRAGAAGACLAQVRDPRTTT